MGNLSQESLIVYIASLIIGLIFCFFGLHLSRLLAVLAGLGLGGVLGAGIAAGLQVDSTINIVITVVAAVLFGVLFFFLRRIGMFFAAFLLSLTTCAVILFSFYAEALINGTVQFSDYQVFAFVGVGISLVLGILAAIFMDPIVIIVTGLWGGSTAGLAVTALFGINSTVASYAIQIVLVILGIVFQFWRRSHKIEKEEAAYAQQIKRENSVESEVERARSLLDEDDEDEDEDY